MEDEISSRITSAKRVERAYISNIEMINRKVVSQTPRGSFRRPLSSNNNLRKQQRYSNMKSPDTVTQQNLTNFDIPVHDIPNPIDMRREGALPTTKESEG